MHVTLNLVLSEPNCSKGGAFIPPRIFAPRQFRDLRVLRVLCMVRLVRLVFFPVKILMQFDQFEQFGYNIYNQIIKLLIHIISITGLCIGRGYNPEKERIQCLNIRPRNRQVANERRVTVLVKHEHGNSVHHLLLFQRGIQIKRVVHVALNEVHIGGQTQRGLARVFGNLFARSAPRRREIDQ